MGRHNDNLRGDHPSAHTGGASGGETRKEGVNRRRKTAGKRRIKEQQDKRRKQVEKLKEGQVTIAMLTLNVCGLHAVRNKAATNATPEAGEAMKYEASEKLQQVIDMMKTQEGLG